LYKAVTTQLHHHHVYQLSHSINAIDPAPHQSGSKREQCSRMFASITHIPSLHNILSNIIIMLQHTQQYAWTQTTDPHFPKHYQTLAQQLN
jgi:hypothetical protein